MALLNNWRVKENERDFLEVIVIHKGLSIFVLLFIDFVLINAVIAQEILTVSNSNGKPGDILSVPVSISEVSSADEVISYQYLVSYNPQILKAIEATKEGTFLAEDWRVVPNANSGLGIMAVGAYGTTYLKGAGIITILQFEVIGKPGDTSDVSLSQIFINAGTPSATSQDGIATVNYVEIFMNTNPEALNFMFDGTTYSVPTIFRVAPGSSHTVDVQYPQNINEDERAVWQSWSDGGTKEHTITSPKIGRDTLNANFKKQFHLLLSVQPEGSGTIAKNPDHEWFYPGSFVTLYVRANSRYYFKKWRGSFDSDSVSIQIQINSTEDLEALFERKSELVLISPNGEETLVIGKNFDIHWESAGDLGTLRLEYSHNGGDTWDFISEVENTVSYLWTVPDVASDSCLIRLTSESSGGLSDTSDTFFKIVELQTIGYALRYDGVDDYVEIPDEETLSGGIGKSITVEAWIRLNNVSGVFPVVMKFLDSNWKDWGYQIKDGRLQVGIESHGDNWELSGGNVLSGEWTHTAFTFDNEGDIVRLYLNGEEVGNKKLFADMPNTEAAVRIGRHGYYNSYFSGDIDEVRIWNYARSGEEIQQDMRKNLTGTESGLIGYWDFDEGDGQIANDLTGGGNNGRLGSSFQVNASDPDWFQSDLSIVPAVQTPQLTLISPVGHERWYTDSIQEIRWYSSGEINAVQLEYSLDDGLSWNTIINTTQNDGLFEWQLPAVTSNEAFIRISDVNDGSINDVSEAEFSVIFILYKNVMVDSLSNNSKGKVFGGKYVENGGWQVTKNEDMIIYDLGTYIENGVLEFEIRNFDPKIQNTYERHHFVSMFRTPWGNHHPVEKKETVWDIHAGFRYNSGIKLLSWTYDENEAVSIISDDWDNKKTYKIKVIWKDTNLELYRDDKLIVTHKHSSAMQLRYLFIGRDFTVSGDLITGFKNNQYPAIVGPIFSNIVVKELITNEDSLLPKSENVQVDDLYANAARISWTTTEPTICYLEYGMNDLYERKTQILGPPINNFSTVISELDSNQIYNYRIISIDNSYNKTISPNYKFTTLKMGKYLFKPIADSFVEPADIYGPTRDYVNFGWMNLLNGQGRESYIRFDVKDVVGYIIDSNLRLFSRQSGNGKLNLRLIKDVWNENNVIWRDKPALDEIFIDNINPVDEGNWLDILVKSVVRNNGEYNFALTSNGTDVLSFDSRESVNNQPELIITSALSIPESIILKKPNGGESWISGTNQILVWSSSQNISKVKIEYSLDNGRSWSIIDRKSVV